MPTEAKPEVRYEDAAELRTGISGWCCKACGRFWGADEHMARYCCATNMPCECGARIEPRHWTHCEACREKRRDEVWAGLSRVEWDGEMPLCVFDDDKFFFSLDDLESYIDDLDDGTAASDLRLVLCEPENGRYFEMSEFLSDDLPDGDDGPDTKEIDATVNAWIKAHAPFSWRATNKAISAESLPQRRPASQE